MGLILLVLSILPPPGFAGSDPSAGHTPSRLPAWGLTAPDVEHDLRDWCVDAYDDDDPDDSAPAQPVPPSGTDDDAICAGVDGRIPPGAARLASSPLAEGGLGPARGHSPDTERPPRAA